MRRGPDVRSRHPTDIPQFDIWEVLSLAQENMVFTWIASLYFTIVLDSQSGSDMLMPRFSWEQLSQDSIVFDKVLQELWVLRAYGDAQFREIFVDKLDQILELFSIWRELKSENIVVTKEQNGARPSKHVSQVMTALVTPEHFTHQDAFLLRLMTLFHDCGKMMSSHIPQEKVITILEQFKHTKQSYPKHAEASVLILYSLCVEWFKLAPDENSPLYTLLKQKLPLVLNVILHHHDFTSFSTFEAGLETVVMLGRGLTEPNLTDVIETVAYLYAFRRADVAATPAHQKHWQGQQALFEQLFSVLSLLAESQVENLAESPFIADSKIDTQTVQELLKILGRTERSAASQALQFLKTTISDATLHSSEF